MVLYCVADLTLTNRSVMNAAVIAAGIASFGTPSAAYPTAKKKSRARNSIKSAHLFCTYHVSLLSFIRVLIVVLYL